MGACRHGERCDRRHNRPTESQTLLFANMYVGPPQYRPGPHGDVTVSEREMEEAFEEFYVDTFAEVSKLGAIDELNVCANPGQHLAGNVYMKFTTEAQASSVLQKLNGRLYDGRPLRGELCPVTDFGEARCRQYSNGSCDRRMCNFLHLREPSAKVQRQLYRWQLNEWKKHRHLEAPPPAVPPMERYESRGGRGGGYDRQDDHRSNRRDDRRYDDRRGPRDYPRRGRSPSPDRRRGADQHVDPFGRDARTHPPSYEQGRHEGMTHSERELEERLAQVRQQLAQAGDGRNAKRERPEYGFEQEGPEHGPKIPRYTD